MNFRNISRSALFVRASKCRSTTIQQQQQQPIRRQFIFSSRSYSSTNNSTLSNPTPNETKKKTGAKLLFSSKWLKGFIFLTLLDIACLVFCALYWENNKDLQLWVKQK
jgi:hypothetical protein